MVPFALKVEYPRQICKCNYTSYLSIHFWYDVCNV